MSTQIPGWTVTEYRRRYGYTEGVLTPELDADGFVTGWQGRLSMGPGYSVYCIVSTLAEAAAWCDERAAEHDVRVSGVS